MIETLNHLGGSLRERPGHFLHALITPLQPGALHDVYPIHIATRTVGKDPDKGRILAVGLEQFLNPIRKNAEVIRAHMPGRNTADIVQSVVSQNAHRTPVRVLNREDKKFGIDRSCRFLRLSRCGPKLHPLTDAPKRIRALAGGIHEPASIENKLRFVHAPPGDPGRRKLKSRAADAIRNASCEKVMVGIIVGAKSHRNRPGRAVRVGGGDQDVFGRKVEMLP